MLLISQGQHQHRYMCCELAHESELKYPLWRMILVTTWKLLIICYLFISHPKETTKGDNDIFACSRYVSYCSWTSEDLVANSNTPVWFHVIKWKKCGLMPNKKWKNGRMNRTTLWGVFPFNCSAINRMASKVCHVHVR